MTLSTTLLNCFVSKNRRTETPQIALFPIVGGCGVGVDGGADPIPCPRRPAPPPPHPCQCRREPHIKIPNGNGIVLTAQLSIHVSRSDGGFFRRERLIVSTLFFSFLVSLYFTFLYIFIYFSSL